MKDEKTIVIDRIIEEVEAQIESAERGKRFNIEESKAHKGAMASRYDTFKEEAQYLAGGYNAQLQELRRTLGSLKSLKDCPPTVTRGSVYAIIEVENLDDGSEARYFLLPAGGGNTYETDGKKITVLNIGAPFARAFFGARAGDDVEFRIQGTTRRFNIVSVI